MNTQAVKSELIQWLTQLDDEKLLTSLSSIKESVESGDWYNQLTVEQKNSLERGIEDHKRGRYLSGKELWLRYEKKI